MTTTASTAAAQRQQIEAFRELLKGAGDELETVLLAAAQILDVIDPTRSRNYDNYDTPEFIPNYTCADRDNRWGASADDKTYPFDGHEALAAIESSIENAFDEEEAGYLHRAVAKVPQARRDLLAGIVDLDDYAAVSHATWIAESISAFVEVAEAYIASGIVNRVRSEFEDLPAKDTVDDEGESVYDDHDDDDWTILGDAVWWLGRPTA